MRAFRVRPGRGGIPVRRLVHAGVAQGGLHLHGPIPGSGLPAVATPRAFHVFRRVGFRQKIEGKKQQQPPAQQEGNTETLMTGLQAHGAASRGGGGASTASDELQTVQKENVDLLSRIERLLGTSLRFIDSRWNISEPVLKLPPPPPVEKPVAHVNLLRSSLTASFAELATDHQPQPQPQPPPAVRTPLPPLPPTTIAATATGEQEQTESSVLHSHSAEDVTTPEPPRPPSEAIGDVQDSAIEPSPQVSDGTAQRGTVPSSPPLPAPPHAGDAESGDLETHTQRSLSHSRGDEGSLPPVASTEAQASAAGELLSEPTPTIPPPAPTTSQPLSDRIEADSAGWPMGACEGALATDSPVSEVDTETVSVAADLQPVTDTSALSETLPHGDAEETAQIPIAEPPTLQADTGDAHATAAVSAATAPQSVFEELQPSRTVTAQAVYMATAGYMPFPTSVPAPNMEAMRSLPRLLALAWVWGSRFAARWGLPSQASPVSTSQPRRESCTAHGGKEDEGQVLAPATVMAGVQGSNDNSTNATASTLPPAPEDAADPALTSALMGLRGILELHARGLLSPGDYRSLGTNSRAQWLLQIVQTRVDALEVPEVLLVLQAMGIMDTTGKMALTDLLVEVWVAVCSFLAV